MKDINDKDFGQNTITLRDNRVATSIIPRTNSITPSTFNFR